MISYSKIFRQAYALMRAHKFLWALGLFLFWDVAFNFISYISGNDKMTLNVNLGANTPILILSGLILALLFLQLCFRGHAAVILGTKALIEKQTTGFGKSFKESKKYYLRLFTVWFVTMFLLALSAAVLASPVAYLLSINYAGRASALGVLALIIFIPLAVLANFVNNLAPIFIVFFDLKLDEAVRGSFDLIKKFWMNLLFFSLWLGILTGIVTYFLVALWRLGVVFFGHLFYNAGGFHITFWSICLGIVAFAAFLIFAGAVAAYQQICWTLLFSELVKPIKTEEPEVVPVPEVV